jgi:N-formylglutamate amidohydrolase
MRFIMKPEFPVFPDQVTVFLLAANTGQSADWPAGADYARVTFASTAGAALAGVFNGGSTRAAWGTSQSATLGSSAGLDGNLLVPAGGAITLQRPRATTGYSVIAPAAGVCHVEYFGRSGSTA